jgi:serine/threonine-protein kinase
MNIGERVGDYEIVEVLGQGGMGQVYKVRNILSERIEAMKVLLPNLEGDSDLADRFLREIKVQAAFDHPNIAKLFTALRASNQLLMVMEFVEGTSLEKLLAKGPLLVGEAVDYASQVLNALAYAHGRGVVHRDIKPANMMRTSSGQVKLLDFGIAHMADSKLTKVGTTVGSLYYMSPEQVKGAPADPRSDLYSLGVVLYEMVTGKRPFQGDSPSSIMAAHLQQTPVAPSEMVPWVLGPLNEIILMAVNKDPEARFQSAEAFRNALQSVASPAADQDKTRAMAVTQQMAVATATTAALPTVQPPQPPVAQSVPQLQSQAPEQPAAQAGQPSAQPDYWLPVPQEQASSRRGLYMALGSIVTLAVLVAAAIEGPKYFRTHAGAPSKTAVQDVQPATVPAQTTSVPAQTTSSTVPVTPQSTDQASLAPGTGTPVAGSAPATSAGSPATTSAASPVMPGTGLASSAGPATSPPQQPVAQTQLQPVKRHDTQPSAPVVSQQPPPASNPRISEAREQYNDLAVRYNTAKESLASVKQQMSSQGLGLRSDVREAEVRVKFLLGEAKDRIAKGDADGAKHNLDMADLALQSIEKFLGH